MQAELSIQGLSYHLAVIPQGPENCVDCRNNFINLSNGRLCVEECPLGTYEIPSTRECAPCFEACVGGCTGPLPYVNISHGCLDCSRVDLDRNGQQVLDWVVCVHGTVQVLLAIM